MKYTIAALLSVGALLAAGCSTIEKKEVVTMERSEGGGITSSEPAAQKSDVSALQGAWHGRIVQGNPEHSCSFVISGNNFEFHDRTDTEVWYKGTYSLHEETNPRQYLAVITDCPFPQYVGKTTKAIYKLEGGKLSITAKEPGTPTFPSSFDDEEAAHMEVTKD